jgi:hypothetical protein
MITFSYLELFIYAFVVSIITLVFNYLINGKHSRLNKLPKHKNLCHLKIGDVYGHLIKYDANNPFAKRDYDYIIAIINISESKKHNGDWYYQYVFLDKEGKPYSCGYKDNMIYSDKYEKDYFNDWEQLESIDVNTIVKKD